MREISQMSSNPIIKLSNISKKYKLKGRSSKTLREDIEKFFHKKNIELSVMDF